jgi:hypothetical protein
LEPGPITFPIAEQDDLGSRGEQVMELGDQRQMHVLGKVPLVTLAHLPYQRQGTPFVDDVCKARCRSKISAYGTK